MRTTQQQKTMYSKDRLKGVRLLVRPQIKCWITLTECILSGSHASPESDLTVHFLVIPAAPWNFLKRLIIQFGRGGINVLIPFVRGWFPPCFLDTFWIVIMSLHQLLCGWELIRIFSHSTDSNETYRQACEPWRWEKRSPQLEPMVARWQNLVPSFPRIAPGWRAWGRNPRKVRDSILQRSVPEP